MFPHHQKNFQPRLEPVYDNAAEGQECDSDRENSNQNNADSPSTCGDWEWSEFLNEILKMQEVWWRIVIQSWSMSNQTISRQQCSSLTSSSCGNIISGSIESLLQMQQWTNLDSRDPSHLKNRNILLQILILISLHLQYPMNYVFYWRRSEKVPWLLEPSQMWKLFWKNMVKFHYFQALAQQQCCPSLWRQGMVDPPIDYSTIIRRTILIHHGFCLGKSMVSFLNEYCLS